MWGRLAACGRLAIGPPLKSPMRQFLPKYTGKPPHHSNPPSRHVVQAGSLRPIGNRPPLNEPHAPVSGCLTFPVFSSKK
jgi:hypothetical protein